MRAPDGRERVLGWPLSYTPPVAPPLLIRNARIIDGTGAPTTRPRDLLVRDGRIARIAAAGTLAPDGARVLDAEGRWLIPGLMDLHAHIYLPELLASYPAFGVTTIRDQGSHIGPLVSFADAIAAGRLPLLCFLLGFIIGFLVIGIMGILLLLDPMVRLTIYGQPLQRCRSHSSRKPRRGPATPGR